jgi:hypothetical protein
MPDTYYSFHIPKFTDAPHASEGNYGIVHVITNAATVELSRYNQQKELVDAVTLDFDDWDEYLRREHMVITPLITRGGACIMLEVDEDGEKKKTLGCLIKYPEFDALFNPNTCCYQALVSEQMDVAQLFFIDMLKNAMVPIGEVMYLKISVLPEESFRTQGDGDRLLFTRLAPPNVRDPVEGKLYVTGLYQPLGRRGTGEVSASPVTFAVNPWDVQLASEYTGDHSRVIQRLR